MMVLVGCAKRWSCAIKVMADTRAGRMELPARTRDPQKLPPGELVEIVGEDGGVLWVARITEDRPKTEGKNGR